MAKELLFSITREDFEWQYFRAGGAGGQNQNKVNSGVRCIHRASGARGSARDSRDQLNNRRSAFSRCLETQEFKAWHRAEVVRRLDGSSEEKSREDFRRQVSDKVDRMMAEANLKVETYDPKVGTSMSIV